MKSFYVYSTLAQDTSYPIWTEGGDVKRVLKHIIIKGGTGVADKRLFTPLGVVTKVSEEDARHLAGHRVFKIHQKNGFVQIRDEDIAPLKAVTEGMQTKDESAQLTPEDFATPPKTSMIDEE